jgi:hypothetical protein
MYVHMSSVPTLKEYSCTSLSASSIHPGFFDLPQLLRILLLPSLIYFSFDPSLNYLSYVVGIKPIALFVLFFTLL